MNGDVFTPTYKLKRPFVEVKRIDVSDYLHDDDGIKSLIHEHCVKQGRPLVLTKLDSLPGWDKDLFDLKRTLQIYGEQGIQIQSNSMDKKILPLAAYVDMLKNQGTTEPSCENSTATSLSETAPESPITPSSPNQLAPDSKPKTPERVPVDDISSVEIDDPIPPLNDGDTHDLTNTQDNEDHHPVTPIVKQEDDITPTTTLSDSTNELPVYTGISERVQTGVRRRKCNMNRSSSPPAKKPKIEKRSHASRSDTDDESDNDDDNDSNMVENDKRNQRNREIYYAKDIDTPDEYKERLPHIVPSSLLPLGNCDLIRTLPTCLQAENLMCYLGGDRTGTALHRDISGAIGHNIMTFAEDDAYAQWLVIDKADTSKLRELCQEDVGGGGTTKKYQQKQIQSKKSYFLECERAWVSPKQLLARGIITHVILQRPGDLVIIPSLCYHQVTNVGISFKMAWNRITAHSLLEGIKVQLPLYNIISRPELYRCKATVYFTLKDILANMPTPSTIPSTTQQQAFLEECRALLHLFAKDMILPEIIEPIAIENVSNDGIIQDGSPGDGETGFDVVCDFCYSDIFHRYYHCGKCEMDICLQCYANGRSCAHLDELCMHEPASTVLKVDESQQNDMNEYIMLYDDIVYQLNKTFGPLSIIPEVTIFQHRGDCYSLATTCRRLEMYRKNNKYLSNKLHCSHCERTFDLREIRRNIKTIFRHRPCYNSLSYSLNSTVFVCFRCSKLCVACSPISSAKNVDAELVYFQDMSKNLELWGGFDDKGLYQSSYWPDFKVKVNPDDTSTIARIEERPWTYPDDFMQLAATELIKNITSEGWKCWGKNESVGESNISMGDLVQQLAQNWTNGYKKLLEPGATLSDRETYTYKPAATSRKSKNTNDSSEYDKYITTTDLKFKIPDVILLEEIIENRGRPRKYPRPDEELEKPASTPTPKPHRPSRSRRSEK